MFDAPQNTINHAARQLGGGSASGRSGTPNKFSLVPPTPAAVTRPGFLPSFATNLSSPEQDSVRHNLPFPKRDVAIGTLAFSFTNCDATGEQRSNFGILLLAGSSTRVAEVAPAARIAGRRQRTCCKDRSRLMGPPRVPGSRREMRPDEPSFAVQSFSWRVGPDQTPKTNPE